MAALAGAMVGGIGAASPSTDKSPGSSGAMSALTNKLKNQFAANLKLRVQ